MTGSAGPRLLLCLAALLVVVPSNAESERLLGDPFGDGAQTPLIPIHCGDGNLDDYEQCDDGNLIDGDGCDSNCMLTGCGNNIATAGEQCDDGNTDSCDGCHDDCTLSGYCGDGVTDPACNEECDDSNNTSGDGCQGDCALPVCGDGVHDAGEECDDGNDVNTDGCTTGCSLAEPIGPIEVLYDQFDAASGNGSPDQAFEAVYGTASCEGADDFEIGTAVGWSIQGVNTVGIYSQQGGGEPLFLRIFFYPDEGGRPGDVALCEYPQVTTFVDELGSYTMTLPSACDLGPGVYWVSQQVRLNWSSGGQHWWSNRTEQSGNEGVWRNPGNKFGTGCVDWSSQTECGVGGGTNPDYLFQLVGQRGVIETPALGQAGVALLGLSLFVAISYILLRAPSSRA